MKFCVTDFLCNFAGTNETHRRTFLRLKFIRKEETCYKTVVLMPGTKDLSILRPRFLYLHIRECGILQKPVSI